MVDESHLFGCYRRCRDCDHFGATIFYSSSVNIFFISDMATIFIDLSIYVYTRRAPVAGRAAGRDGLTPWADTQRSSTADTRSSSRNVGIRRNTTRRIGK